MPLSGEPMSRGMKRAAILLCLLLALGASLAGSASAAPASTERLRTLDQQILAALNKTRATHGLRTLAISRDLEQAAVAHSQDMLEEGFFAHDSANGTSFATRVRGFYRPTGYDNWSAGENLLYNTEEMSAEIAVATWLASPSHRKNMLAPEWREVGIASLHASTAGGIYEGAQTWVITMDFGTRSDNLARKTSAAKPKAKARPRVAGKARKVRSEEPGRMQGLETKKINRFLPTAAHGSIAETEGPTAIGTAPPTGAQQ